MDEQFFFFSLGRRGKAKDFSIIPLPGGESHVGNQSRNGVVIIVDEVDVLLLATLAHVRPSSLFRAARVTSLGFHCRKKYLGEWPLV